MKKMKISFPKGNFGFLSCDLTTMAEKFEKAFQLIIEYVIDKYLLHSSDNFFKVYRYQGYPVRIHTLFNKKKLVPTENKEVYEEKKSKVPGPASLCIQVH